MRILGCFGVLASAMMVFGVLTTNGLETHHIDEGQTITSTSQISTHSEKLASIPNYEGMPFCYLDGNNPSFSEEELTTTAFERYSKLDSLGRCGVCYANVGKEVMPTEERGLIGMLKPTGWSQAKYPGIINSDPPYLYNRCHLIGFQLTGENANENNLITGTRYMNTEGMLHFENIVANYVASTDNHVLYRVTPIFEGDNLLSSGVEMEAKSVEDNGQGVSFHVFVFNVQPGILIDYSTGNSQVAELSLPSYIPEKDNSTESAILRTQQAPIEDLHSEYSYVLNKNTHVFHYPTCKSVSTMKEKNKIYSAQTREEIINSGYKSCGNCHP